MIQQKHIAVILRGHVRTWLFNAPKVFEFYEKIAENVDYYFTTWDTSNIEGVKETFQIDYGQQPPVIKNRNLVHFQIISSELDNSILEEGKFEGRWYNGHLGPPFMNTLILPYKRLREKELGKKYDCIFDTRPDVLPVRAEHIWGEKTGEPLTFNFPEKNSVYTTGLEIQINQSQIAPMKGSQDIAIQDWLLYMDSDTFEKMSLRYHSDEHLYEIGNGPGTQIELREYISERGMSLCIADWINAYMVRPTAFQLDWKDQRDNEIVVRSSSKWTLLDSEQKSRLCERYGVAINDYKDTHSLTCKI